MWLVIENVVPLRLLEWDRIVGQRREVGDVMAKMRDEKWLERPMLERMAAALYPHVSSPTVQKQMMDRVGSDPVGDRAGLQRRISEGNRLYGKVEPSAPVNTPSQDYLARMGLLRK